MSHEPFQVLQPETIFPCQLEGARPVSGERRLMIGILENAVVFFRGGAPCNGTPERRLQIKQRRAEEAARWFRSEERDYVFAFLRICEALDLDPEAFRRRLWRTVSAEAA